METKTLQLRADGTTKLVCLILESLVFYLLFLLPDLFLVLFHPSETATSILPPEFEGLYSPCSVVPPEHYMHYTHFLILCLTAGDSVIPAAQDPKMNIRGEDGGCTCS